MRPLVISLLCLICGVLCAQETSSDHFRYSLDQREYFSEVRPDLSLFLIPLEGGSDVFTSMSTFNFSAVKYLRRGYDYKYTSQYVNGIDFTDAISGNSNFSLIAFTRKIRPKESYKSGLASELNVIGGLCGIAHSSVRARDVANGGRVTVSTSDRRYGLAMDISTSSLSQDGKWAYVAAISRRFGRDGHIEGVFTDESSINFSVDYIFNRKHALNLFVTAAATEHGLRSASTAEAFCLTGDNLYNPSWGYFNGKVRNSKVAKHLQPLLMATYDAKISDNTTFTTAITYQFGESSLSGMSWQNAQTPQPDYYRAMPSYFANQNLANVVRDQWRGQDSDITQINWDELYLQNRLNGDEALYLSENRVENIDNIQFVATAQSKINDRIEIDYGVRFKRDAKQNYKQAKDLIGAEYLMNTDKYLTNEDSYGEPMQNDLHEPNRRIYRGDSFGYNYDLRLNQWNIFARIGYRENKLALSCGAELGGVQFWRYGNYQKESSSNFNSYGVSKRSDFSTYKVKLSVGYSFSPLHNADATLMLAKDSPDVDNVFINPVYSNHISDMSNRVTVTAAETNYNLTLNPLKVKLSIYHTQINGGSESYRYYDDISTNQSNLMLSGIDKRHYGVEIGADAQVVHGLSLRLAASLGRFTYSSDPRADIVSDADMTTTLSNESVYLMGYKVSGMPQSVLSGEIKYSGGYGWLVTLTINHMANSFVNINPVRRMHRSTALADSPELLEQLTTQEKLPDATTVNIFLLKSFTLWKQEFYFIGSINNILNNKNIIYSGYEQMRLQKRGRGFETSYAPFNSKYQYSYGRTFFCSLNYKF